MMGVFLFLEIFDNSILGFLMFLSHVLDRMKVRMTHRNDPGRRTR